MRSPILLLGVALSGVALVALPAQDLPILVVDDVAMIARSLTILAMAATVAAAGWARRGEPWRKALAVPAATAAVLSLVAVAGYKAIGGIGWPTPRILLGAALATIGAAAGFGIGAALRDRRRWAALALAVPVAVFGIGPAGAVATELAEPDFGPASLEDCQEHARVRYCAIDGFEGLVDDWAVVVEGVLAEVPPETAEDARLLPVVQLGDAGQRPGTVTLARPLTGWGRPAGGEGNAQAALALGVAAVAVDGCVAAHDPESEQPPAACEVVIWWLAGQLSPDTAGQVSDTGRFADNVSGTNYADSPVPSVAASHYAAQLLARDDNDVGAALRERWATFTDPATPASELVDDLGLVLVVEPLADG